MVNRRVLKLRIQNHRRFNMKITRVKAHAMSMKLDKVYWTSRAPWGTYNTIVVEVETDDGITGIGTINKTPLKDIAEIVDSPSNSRL